MRLLAVTLHLLKDGRLDITRLLLLVGALLYCYFPYGVKISFLKLSTTMVSLQHTDQALLEMFKLLYFDLRIFVRRRRLVKDDKVDLRKLGARLDGFFQIVLNKVEIIYGGRVIHPAFDAPFY